MNILTTTAPITRPERPTQGIDDILASGFENFIIDGNMYLDPGVIMRWDRLLTPEKEQWIENDITSMKEALVERNITPVAVYLPFPSTSMMRTDYVDVLLRYCKKLIHEFEEIGVDKFIARPITVNISSEELDKTNEDYYHALSEECKNPKTKLLLVNSCKSVGGHLVRGMFSDPIQAKEWIGKLNSQVGAERFGFCCDIGAYTLVGKNLQDTLNELKGIIDMIILKDNDGLNDESLLMFFGQRGGANVTDLVAMIRGLREISYDGDLVIDATTSISFCPAMLWPEYMKFVKKIAEYIKWQVELETSLRKYDNIVLFGAGNMCRAFMKAYGHDIHPLFTCDNNPASWGTTFEGLEVKNPETLKGLPDNTGVYICNMYYTQIEAQLKEMGIKNIEFFNDEYLPVYHEHRIDRNKKKISE